MYWGTTVIGWKRMKLISGLALLQFKRPSGLTPDIESAATYRGRLELYPPIRQFYHEIIRDLCPSTQINVTLKPLEQQVFEAIYDVVWNGTIFAFWNAVLLLINRFIMGRSVLSYLYFKGMIEVFNVLTPWEELFHE